MAKELIISVNGREKKIAVLENGHVTEFYIERGEENSGVVGNIYKGKVQRVLPGMQSAFVEIGLERDAFLYVSDFFDEEEELERIIQEKSKRPEDAAEASRDAFEEIRNKRLQREKQMEDIQELAEPIAEDLGESAPKRAAMEEDTPGASQMPAQSEEERKGKKRRKGKREREAERLGIPLESLSGEAPQAADGASAFERIIDDEETTGDLFKDAFIQEAISDEIRSVEFDMEPANGIEVGSLLPKVKEEMAFERIADDDDEETPQEPKKGGRFQKRGRGGNRRNNRDNQPQAEAEVKAEEAPAAEKPADRPGKKRPARGKKEAPKKEEAKISEAGETAEKAEKPGAPKGKSPAKGRSGGRGKKPAAAKDAEASVKEASGNAEMTVRRGGRGRGRRGSSMGPGGPPRKYNKEERYETSEVSEAAYSENEVSGADVKSEYRSRRPPTISELLREGQEVLVQIAKEPIARKGARITSHISLPGRYLVYMPTVDHTGVSRKIENGTERGRLRNLIQKIRNEEDVPSGGFIVRTAGIGVSEQNLRDDARYLVRTWLDMKKTAEKSKSPALVHQDLDLIQRILRDQLSEDFTAIRVDSEEEYLNIVEFVNRIQPRMVSRVKLYTRSEPILEMYGVQDEINKAIKPRVWLKSGGYLVINQTEALVAIDVNTGKFVGKGATRLEDTITKTNMEAVEEVSRQIRLRDLGGIIVLDLIDMEDRRNRARVLQSLNEHLAGDKSPTKVLPFNDFGLVIMTRKRVKQSLERTICSPCANCQGAGWVKSPQTVCYEILEEARRLSKGMDDIKHSTLRVNPEVAKALREEERVVMEEIEAYLGNIDVTADAAAHQEQFDFAFI